MPAIHSLSSPKFPFSSSLSAQHHHHHHHHFPFTPSTHFTILKSLHPLHSLSSNASLQNQTFPSSNNNTNTNNIANEKSDEDDDERKVKVPTAPWMKGPLLLPHDQVLDLQKPKRKEKVGSHNVDWFLTEKVSGRLGKKAMKKIVEKIERLDFVDAKGNSDDTQIKKSDFGGGFLFGEVKSDVLDDTQKIWDGTQKKEGDFGGGFLFGEVESEESKVKERMPWEIDEKTVFRRVKKERVVTAADLTLDKDLLWRLRKEGSKMRTWIKVMKLGVTQAVVDQVHSVWSSNELVMLKFHLPLCRNMDRAREIFEIKTGGLVVCTKKEFLVAYRGCDYEHKRRLEKKNMKYARGGRPASSMAPYRRLGSKLKSTVQLTADKEYSVSAGLLMDRDLGTEPARRSLYEREADRVLDGLGPRFIDWWYPKPLPVDGDLLPEFVPGFKPPFRQCPPGVRQRLTDDELMHLRHYARRLPVHFVLGRNSKLQGLAVSIIKLWERIEIAKIAIKWGVLHTNNELMASEIKRLTGGVLILRNKFFITFYRGKDFLPVDVANSVIEREIELRQWYLHEENARLKAVGSLQLDAKTEDNSTAGTYSEFQHIQTILRPLNDISSEAEMKLEAEKERLKKELNNQEHKLAILNLKIEKVEEELSRLNSAWKPSEEEPDQEFITEEERECFRKMGLKMDRVLVLGRRGVFDGVIQGLHQHWKHSELVKVINMQKTFMRVFNTARLLARESGGILVSIEKLKKGHAIIIYRGKNYKRPIIFTKKLLTRRKALKRSLEMQRLGSLKFFAYQRQKEVADLRHKLDNLEKRRNEQSV